MNTKQLNLFTMKINEYSFRSSSPRYIIILKLCFVVCALIITCSNPISANTPSGSSGNPYKVLGVSSNASQEDIKKCYRKLCLKFHPDKNVGSDDEERKRCEDAFKSIQQANSLIGDEESRRKHDSMSMLNRRNGQGLGDPFDHFRQQFNANTGFNPNAGRYERRRPAFNLNGVDISHLFQARPSPLAQNGGNPFFAPQSNVVIPNSPKSVFVEKVTIPLEDLYGGLDRKEFFVSNGIFKRYIAAFRGGIAGPIALNGLFASTPMLLRRSWPLPVFCFLVAFHFGLPRPTRLYYSSQIKKGWKGGTKLKFFDMQSGLEVVFVIKEGQHDRFTRDGDNLRTSITIGKSKARKGCSVLIDALHENELPIIVKLRAGQIKQDDQVVTVKGRGWPIQSSGSKGDLLVTFSLVSDARAAKIRNRKKRIAKRDKKARG